MDTVAAQIYLGSFTPKTIQSEGFSSYFGVFYQVFKPLLLMEMFEC